MLARNRDKQPPVRITGASRKEYAADRLAALKRPRYGGRCVTRHAAAKESCGAQLPCEAVNSPAAFRAPGAPSLLCSNARLGHGGSAGPTGGSTINYTGAGRCSADENTVETLSRSWPGRSRNRSGRNATGSLRSDTLIHTTWSSMNHVPRRNDALTCSAYVLRRRARATPLLSSPSPSGKIVPCGTR